MSRFATCVFPSVVILSFRGCQFRGFSLPMSHFPSSSCSISQSSIPMCVFDVCFSSGFDVFVVVSVVRTMVVRTMVVRTLVVRTMFCVMFVSSFRCVVIHCDSL